MLPYRQFLLCLLILILSFLFVRSTTPLPKFNIVLTTPDKTSPPTVSPHKSVHVKYTLSKDEVQRTIVGFEPQLQAHKKAVEQLTVHLCNASVYQSIWYDDKTICNRAQSMLIYEWAPPSSSSPFLIRRDCGFQLNKFKSIILTVVYKTEKRVHKEQSGIILYISTQAPKFQMGTMFVGNKQRGAHFSCRSSDSPYLLYATKKLNFNKNDGWWRIHIIRVRQFGRKLVQSIFNSKTISNVNQTNIELVSSDLFLMNGDYLLIECENKSQMNCYFLIYYIYKSKFLKNDNICQNNDFPKLFNLIPTREILNTNQTTMNKSRINGTGIFLIVCIVLFTIWISIIIGCIIMRRIRGLANYRTEPTSPLSSQKNKPLSGNTGRTTDQCNQRTGEADHVIQIDAEQAGVI